MKLLYLLNARIPTPRAYGLQVMKTCEAFGRAGVELELVIPKRKADSGEEPFSYYGIKELFIVTTLSVPDFLNFGSFGFFISALWFSEKARWLKSFWAANVIYSRDALVLVQYLLLGRKIIFEAHARPTFVSRIVARRAYRLVVISQGLREVYVAAGVPSKKIIIAPDAVDEHLFDGVPSRERARKELKLPSDARIALYAGHLYARKGADTFAAAAKLIPEVECLFVGGAEVDIEAFKKKWGSVPNIKILGHVPHEQVPLYLRAADVLVLPNSGKDEDSSRFTSPMKLFEYMASGTPIVASDVPSLREILDETSANLVTPDDSTALAVSMRDLLVHPNEAQARAGRACAQALEFTWNERVKMILHHLV